MLKKQKRILLLLIASIFACLAVNVIPASAVSSKNEKYDVLCALGFFSSDAEYNENMSVTRLEVINAILNSLPEERRYKYSGEDTGFEDIASDDAIASTAYNAKMLGILGEETELRPYDAATREETYYMILALLGYNMVTDIKSNSTAKSTGLTKGVSGGEKFTLAQLTTILYNALNVKVIMPRISVSNNSYMNEILKVGYGKGIVTANRFTGISGQAVTRYGRIRIGYDEYDIGNTCAEDYIGENICFYYRIDNDKSNQLLYIKAFGENSLEIDADRIVDFKGMTYTYQTGETLNATRRITIQKSADIIFNGKVINSDVDIYKPSTGNIKLIDFNGDGKYETVKITSYDVVTVDGIDKEKGIITDLYNPVKKYSVDLYNDIPKYEIYDIDGNKKKFSDIFKYDTIFIAQSYDKDICSIIISDKTVRGTVSRCSNDEIIIDGMSYEATDEFLSNAKVEVCSYGVFHLDPKGRLGCFESSVDANIKAGYLLQAKHDKREDLLLVKLINENGEELKLYSWKKLFYTNGNDPIPARTKVNNIDDVVTLLNSAKKTEFGGGTIILYKTNPQGRITEIEVPADYTTDITRSETLDNRGIFRQLTPKMSDINHKTGLFLLSMRIETDTKVFKIPNDINNADKFEVHTGYSKSFAWNAQYTVVGFAKNKNAQYADYVIAFSKGSSGSFDEDNVFIVEKVKRVLNSDDEIVKAIEGKWGTASKEFYLDYELSENEINKGDILRLSIDEDNNVTAMEKVLDIKNPTLGTRGSLTKTYYSYFGYAYDFKGTTLRVATRDPSTVTSTDQLINTFVDKMATIYRYDTSSNTLELADYSSITTNKTTNSSRIFAWFYYADHKVMVIYD